MALHRETPVVTRELGDLQLLYKMEAWQPAGSFKIRGIGHLCEHAQREGAERLVASSGGNAGAAMAYAARELGLPATVFVPSTTPAVVRHRIEAFGAAVQIAGEVWDATDAHAREVATDPSIFYVPPFQHPLIWTGHATMVRELKEQIERPDAIVLSVGGGGLMAGVLEGLDDVGWGTVPVLAVETEGAASFAASWEAGEVVELDAITSIAKTLGAKRVSEQAFTRATGHDVSPWVVSDRDAVAACVRFADEERVLVEPSCGAALAAAYEPAAPLAKARRVVVIVCGGSGASLDELAQWRAVTGV